MRSQALTVAGVLSLAVCAIARSPQAPEKQQTVAREPQLPGDVYINDSFEATDALNKARLLTGQQRWREAAELLQQTSDALGDRVVQSSGAFIGLRLHVAEWICAWPDEGLRVYQSLYDSELQRELAALDDAADLHAAVRLFDLYFCTTGAAVMADQIAQLAVESGDLPLAQWALRRVLEKHPARQSFGGRYQALLTLVSAMGGKSTPPESGQTRVRWQGRDAALDDALRDISREFDLDEQPEADDWPVLGGNPQRNRHPKSVVDEPGLLWHAKLDSATGPAAKDSEPGDLLRGGGDAGRQAPTVPVVVGDHVYVQVGRNVIALHRSSGAVAWAFRDEDEENPESPYLDDKPIGGDTPAVDGGRLFAALPADDNAFYDYDSSRDVPELVAIDARVGTELWRVAQKNADAQGTISVFDSAPVTRNGRVYIVSRRKRSFGFEDCYLDAYRAADGSLLFHTHLASASTATLGVKGITRSTVAIEGDSIYLGTNLGAVAAVNAYTGGIRWLRLYDRLRPDAPGGSVWPVRDAAAAALNPAICDANRVVVLPSDSSHLLVLDVTDGHTLYDVPVTRLANMHTLYGVEGDVVCGAGEDVFCYDLSREAMIWSSRAGDQSTISGRGLWSGDELLVPRRDGLGRIQVPSGKSDSLAMGPHYSGGNVLALPHEIFVASPRALLCYVRKADIWRNIQTRMTASPGDPLPALEFFEIALGAGDLGDARTALDEAIARTKPSLSAAPPSLRNRIFADVLKLLASHPATSQDAEKIFRYASETATTIESQVEYRFRFAEFFESAGEPRRALRLYQQILRDRTLRDWPPARTDASAARAHTRAEAKISELIRRLGVEVYAEMEAQAQLEFEAAKTARDGEGLEQVAIAFPNSRASLEAVMEHAGLLEKNGQFASGAVAWQRAYSRHHEPVRRQEILRHIAECHEKAGRPELAYLWLAKATREFPAAVMERGGKATTFAEYRDQLQGARARVEPSRPRLDLPLAPGSHQDLVGPVHLMVPVFFSTPEMNWDHVFVQNPDGIRAYRGDTGEKIWGQPAPVPMNAELLAARGDFAVFATPFEVFALNANSGERRYSRGEYPPRLQDPGADWEDGRNFRLHALHGDRLVSLREDGGVECIDIKTGDVVWTGKRQSPPVGPMALNESVLVSPISRDGHAVLQIVNAATGDLLDSIVTDEQRPVEDIHITLDGLLIVVTSKSLACYDPATQARRWETALNWPVRRATLQYDMDSLYLVDDTGVLRKIALDTGQPVWESQRVIGRGEDNETLDREGDFLIVSTSSSISAVDVANGQLLWQGTTPDSPHFVQRVLTQSYAAALHAPEGAVDGIGQLFFYDHRNASGVIPKSGGVLDLGVVTDIRGVIAANGGMFIQTGSTIRSFISAK